MKHIRNRESFLFTLWVKALQSILYSCDGAWLRCNCLKGNYPEKYYLAYSYALSYTLTEAHYTLPKEEFRIIDGF